MFGFAVLILLGIAIYFGYVKGLHLWQTYLAQRLEILKAAEAEIMKGIADNATREVRAPVDLLDDTKFRELLDKNFIAWGRTKGIIR